VIFARPFCFFAPFLLAQFQCPQRRNIFGILPAKDPVVPIQAVKPDSIQDSLPDFVP
jgi:hypothetical protein